MEAHGPLAGRSVLVARSDAAADDIPKALSATGAFVREVVAYQTVEGPASSRRPLRRALVDPSTRVVVFTSGSAVRGAVALAGPARPRLRELRAVTIGPSTSAVARDAGLAVVEEARRPGLEQLVAAVLRAVPRP
jgi:uroporphyrinogen-III synthase